LCFRTSPGFFALWPAFVYRRPRPIHR
jgi:hypothetical protein